MVWFPLLITVYCTLLVLASLGGGWLPSLIHITHVRMQLMMSLVGGLMMGVALLHLLPHAVVETNSLDYAAWSSILGLLAMFLTIRVFQVHQHGPVSRADCERPGCEHLEAHAHDHPAHEPIQPQSDKPAPSSHPLAWTGLFFGLGIHSLIDGIAVGASVTAAAEHGAGMKLVGAGTFLAVLLHKPLDSLSVTSVMLAGDWSARARNIVNILFSLICPCGALLFFFGARTLGDHQHLAVGCALGFSAGVFLCISLADILPEIQFHRHDRAVLFAAILSGVAIAFVIGLFEPKHAHEMPAPASSSEHVHPANYLEDDQHTDEVHAAEDGGETDGGKEVDHVH